FPCALQLLQQALDLVWLFSNIVKKKELSICIYFIRRAERADNKRSIPTGKPPFSLTISIDMKWSNLFTIDECTWCKQLGKQSCRQRIKGGFGNIRYSHRPMKSDQFRSFLNRYM